MDDLGRTIESEGLEFTPLRDESFPPGTLREVTRQLAVLEGLQSLKFAIECACRVTNLILKQGTPSVRSASIDALLVDQNEPAGGTIAEHLGLPFVSVCTSLLLNREPSIPPPFVGWGFGESALARARNRIGYAVADRFIDPIQKTMNEYRERWHLSSLKGPDDSFSRLAQIGQFPREFDFPRRSLSPTFHYCGPFFDNFHLDSHDFPFHKLDGRPVIYGSLGTLQTRDHWYFHEIAKACYGLDAQLVLSLGSQTTFPLPDLPGNPIVVNYAPQLELLSRASATITHAGMNTVQQSLYFGVPSVAIPLTHDQPAIAARLARTGAGIVVPRKKFGATVLREAVRAVLRAGNPYKRNAQRMQRCSKKAGGISRAAEIAESVLSSGRTRETSFSTICEVNR